MNLSCEDKSHMEVLLDQFPTRTFYTNFPFLCSRWKECALKILEGFRGGNLAEQLEHWACNSAALSSIKSQPDR